MYTFLISSSFRCSILSNSRLYSEENAFLNSSPGSQLWTQVENLQMIVVNVAQTAQLLCGHSVGGLFDPPIHPHPEYCLFAVWIGEH